MYYQMSFSLFVRTKVEFYNNEIKYILYILTCSWNFYINVVCAYIENQSFSSSTVSENIIATIKMRNNFCHTLKMVIFSIAPCKVITLNPLCILFGISLLIFFMASFLKLSLFQYRDSCRSFLKALKGDSDKRTVTFR